MSGQDWGVLGLLIAAALAMAVPFYTWVIRSAITEEN